MGTSHLGKGPCRRHLGNVPNVVKRYARQEAIEFARKHLDANEDIDPLDAALENVRVMQTLVRYQREKLGLSETVADEDVRITADITLMAQRAADIAIRAGVADRLVALAERQTEPIIMAAEEALAVVIALGVQIDNSQRTAFADALADGLIKHGDTIEGRAITAKATA